MFIGLGPIFPENRMQVFALALGPLGPVRSLFKRLPAAARPLWFSALRG